MFDYIIANQELVAYKFDFLSKQQDIYFTRTGRNVDFRNYIKLKLKKECKIWKIMFKI